MPISFPAESPTSSVTGIQCNGHCGPPYSEPSLSWRSGAPQDGVAVGRIPGDQCNACGVRGGPGNESRRRVLCRLFAGLQELPETGSRLLYLAVAQHGQPARTFTRPTISQLPSNEGPEGRSHTSPMGEPLCRYAGRYKGGDEVCRQVGFFAGK